MICSEARFALEAEPASGDPALAAHCQACAGCAAFRQELLELDRRLRAALEIPVPGPVRPMFVEAGRPVLGAAVTASKAPSTSRRRYSPVRQFALAASVAGVAVLAGLLWAGFPRESLAHDVVEHMAHEPQAWSTSVEVPPAAVAEALERRGLTLQDGVEDVTYVETCWFRGRRVPHLVVRTESGPVTIMVLDHEPVTQRTSFEEGGFRGVLVPAPRGAVAVLARDDADVDAAAARALESIRY